MNPIRLMLLACLYPATLLAAENLGPEGLDSTYVPIPGSRITCTADGEDKADKKCTTQPTPATRSLTDKALRDAEHQITNESIANPQLNNPDALPPQLPPQPAMPLPTPQDLLDRWNNRPPF